MPSPLRSEHGDYDEVVALWTASYRRKTKGLRGGRNSTVILDVSGECQPDGHLRIPQAFGGQTRIEAGFIVGPPELVIEIARSSRYYDLNDKKADYERGGVLEYVVFELDPDQVHWFVRRGDHFEDLPPGAMGSIAPRSSPASGSIPRRSMPKTSTGSSKSSSRAWRRPNTRRSWRNCSEPARRGDRDEHRRANATQEDPPAAGGRRAPRPAHVPRALRGDAAGDAGRARRWSRVYAVAVALRSRRGEPYSSPAGGSTTRALLRASRVRTTRRSSSIARASLSPTTSC